MLEESSFIKDEDFVFENTSVSVIVNRNCLDIELASLKISPFRAC